MTKRCSIHRISYTGRCPLCPDYLNSVDSIVTEDVVPSWPDFSSNLTSSDPTPDPDPDPTPDFSGGGGESGGGGATGDF